MDCGLVVERAGRPAVVRNVPVSDVRAGDAVVCGAHGVRVEMPPAVRPRRGGELRLHELGGVQREAAGAAGPPDRRADARGQGRRASGSSGSAARRSCTPAPPRRWSGWCEAGYVDVLFAGNALATHDIESSLFGTSLGVDLAKGSGVPHGHEHHIRAINTDPRGRLDRRGGGVRRPDRRRDARDGARPGKPFVLVGSVRDDGPLPDVYTDVIEGQRAMRAQLPDVGFAIMVRDDAALDRDREPAARVDPAGVAWTSTRRR